MGIDLSLFWFFLRLLFDNARSPVHKEVDAEAATQRCSWEKVFGWLLLWMINFKVKMHKMHKLFDDNNFRVMKNVHQTQLLNLAARQISNYYKKANS